MLLKKFFTSFLRRLSSGPTSAYPPPPPHFQAWFPTWLLCDFSQCIFEEWGRVALHFKFIVWNARVHSSSCISFAQLGAVFPSSSWMNWVLLLAGLSVMCLLPASASIQGPIHRPQSTQWFCAHVHVILCKLPWRSLYLPRGQEWALACCVSSCCHWSGPPRDLCTLLVSVFLICQKWNIFLFLILCLPFHCFEGFQRKCGGVNHSLETAFWWLQV